VTSPGPAIADQTVRGRRFEVRASTAGPSLGEVALAAGGAIVPAAHRSRWAELMDHDGLVVDVWDVDSEKCACSLIVDIGRTRTLPGHKLWRVDRLGGYPDVDAIEASIRALHGLVVMRASVLRLSLGIFEPNSDARSRLADVCQSLGFRKEPFARSYERTLRIDLSGSEDEILQQMRASGRRHVRNREKGELEVRLIDDPALAPRIDELAYRAMNRTGGNHRKVDWVAVMKYCLDVPDVARLTGLFSPSLDKPLVGFALGLREGDHVEYNTAGSSRGQVKAAIGYGPAWDLISWARRTGAAWFDFGGIPAEDAPPSSVSGIARFKRNFGGAPIEVREEWAFEPSPFKASVSRGISESARVIGELTRRR